MRQSKQPKVKRAYTAKQIAKRIDALGDTIRRDTGPGEVFLLGMLKGAGCFLADLMRAIPGDVAYGYIDVIRDIADTDTAAALEIDFVSHTEIAEVLGVAEGTCKSRLSQARAQLRLALADLAPELGT